jgi:hypothetical protein
MALPEFFIESWLYNSALSVIDQCDEWIFTSKVEESQLLGHYAVKGELLELAQMQVYHSLLISSILGF